MSNQIAELLATAKEVLPAKYNALLEAQVLLAHALGWDRSKLYAWPEFEVTDEIVTRFQSYISRRQAHEPIAYIVGYKEFWSLIFKVTRDTLIPRADTELLVETVLNLMPPSPLTIADIGTGCGAIGCALAKSRPNWRVFGGDVSAEALAVARENAASLAISNIEFRVSDWLTAFSELKFNCIVGNPPYIREYDLHLTRGDVNYEPRLALTAGPRGLECFQIILLQAAKVLIPGGLIAFEHGYDQGAAVRALLEQAGYYDVTTKQDLAGLERVTYGCSPV